MTKRSRAEEEPYTFAGGEVRLTGLEELHGKEADAALKESVAAHQAECLCHSLSPDEDLGCRRMENPVVAVDRAGGQWHVDPLCKVRPEAKA